MRRAKFAGGWFVELQRIAKFQIMKKRAGFGIP